MNSATDEHLGFSFFSPAKLNLFFRVLAMRPDGYHEIASLYQAIDLCDELVMKKANADGLSCSDPTLSCGESNLVSKALRLFRQHYELHPVQIHLEKRIPMQSGLGGGSSNAATTLWALNELAGGRANLQELIAMGAQIGSDVSFFFSSGSAYCTGRGEIIESLAIPPISGYLAKPPFGLSTPLVYRETKVKELKMISPREALQEFISSNHYYFNDLEPAAFRIEPRLAIFKKRLQAYFDQVSMTGSGTAFFCLGTPSQPLPDDIQFIAFRSTLRGPSSWYCPRA